MRTLYALRCDHVTLGVYPTREDAASALTRWLRQEPAAQETHTHLAWHRAVIGNRAKSNADRASGYRPTYSVEPITYADYLALLNAQ